MAVQGTRTDKFYEKYPFLEKRGKSIKSSTSEVELFPSNTNEYTGKMVKLTESESNLKALAKMVAEVGTKEQKAEIKSKIRPLILKEFKNVKTSAEAKELLTFVKAFCEKDEQQAFNKYYKYLSEAEKQSGIAARANKNQYKNKAIHKEANARANSEHFKEKFMKSFSENDAKSLEKASKAAEEAAMKAENEAKEALAKTMEHKLNVNPSKVGIGETIPPQPPFKAGQAATSSVEELTAAIEQERNAAFNNPASELARGVVKPSVPKSFIPSQKPELTPEKFGEIYREGLQDGIKRGKNGGTRVTNNSYYTNIYNTLVEEGDRIINNVNESVNVTLEQHNHDVRVMLEENNQNITNLETTINQNSQKVEKQFNTFVTNVNGRFNQVDKKLGTIENRLGSIEGTLGQMNGRLGNIERTLGQMDGRLGTVEVVVGQLGQQVGQLGQKVDQFGQRLGKLEAGQEAILKGQQQIKRLGWAGLAGLAGVAVLTLLDKCSGGDDKAPAKQTLVDGKPTIVVPVDTTKVDTTKVDKSDEYMFNPDAVPKVEAPKLDVEIPEFKPLTKEEFDKYFPEQIANGDDILNGNLTGKKVYVAQKGDCIWNISKRILQDSPELKKEIEGALKYKTEDAIIQVLTMRICKALGINYYEKHQRYPQIGQELNIPDKYLKEIIEKYKEEIKNGKTLTEILSEKKAA